MFILPKKEYLFEQTLDKMISSFELDYTVRSLVEYTIEDVGSKEYQNN